MNILPTAALDFAPAPLPGSVGSNTATVLAAEGVRDLSVDILRLAPGGLVPGHAGRRDQVCLVLDGNGWVHDATPAQRPIRRGDIVHWSSGEERGIGTDEGLLLLSLRCHSGTEGSHDAGR
ncbi:hypothetical protein [Kitasatospora sp. NPDC097643]|uniref:hypothetical protein n=1 Tax=Kitasatospora sp. NPDC097643 TaxID=3157230 RepID=UPI00331D48AE